MHERLITFGDSWTAGHGVETQVQYKEVIDCGLFINTLRNGNGWPRYLAQHYDIPFVNLGVCNYSNPEIIQRIKQNLKHLSKNDLIIIMLSYAFRGEGQPEHDIPKINELLKGYNYFMVNSFYPTFKEVPQHIIDTLDISRFINPEMTMAEFLIYYEKVHNTSVWEYGCRKVSELGSFLGGDFHPNTLGYKTIAWELYNRIPKNQ